MKQGSALAPLAGGKLYEIINPSDPYTIEAPSLDVAFVACLFLGTGQYAFKPLDEDGEEIPLFIFGGMEAWCAEHLEEGFEAVVTRVTTEPAKRKELADCFDSCLIGRREDRNAYRAGLELIDDPAKREQWRDRWHDDRRSSLNNIGARAFEMASKLREGLAPLAGGESTP
jgi:hypothetical protein